MKRLAVFGVLLFACHRPPAKPVPPVTVGVGSAAAPVPVVTHDDTLIVPCAESAVGDVRTRLEALDPRFYNLRAVDPVAPLITELQAILSTPCYGLARIDADVNLSDFDNGESLRSWWTHGGESWIRSYLPHVDWTGPATVTLAPTVRTAMTAERGPVALQPLLCPLKALDDDSCGVETAGWRIRAEGIQQHVTESERDKWCEKRARDDTSGALKYSLYRSCLADGVRADSLPLGAFRAPKEGWLVLSPSAFIVSQGCRENLALYDLASGSAYAVGCTNRIRPARLRIGRVSTAALREAAWMMMVQHTALSVRRYDRSYRVPTDFEVAHRPNEMIPSERGFVSVSDAPGLTWAWLRPGDKGTLKGAMNGHVYSADNSISGHAYELFEIMEASFQEGCAPLSLPGTIPWDNLGPRIDGRGRPDAPPPFDWLAGAKAILTTAHASKSGCAMLP